MRIILDQDQHAMGLFEESDQSIESERRASRGVIFDKDGRVAMMHFLTTGSYKLPGGGIDEGETEL